MKVSIIIPVIRPEKAQRCIDAIKQNAGIPADQYEIITEEDKERIGCPKMVKRLTEKTQFDIVCFLGDDNIPQTDFLKNALEAMSFIPEGWGLVGFNDNPRKTASATQWLAHKALLPHLNGEFFHTGYTHCFCDDELVHRCIGMGRFMYAYNAIIFHDHPLVQGKTKEEIESMMDEDYKRVYDQTVYKADQLLFERRRANHWVTPDAAHIIDSTKIKPPMIAVAMPSNDHIYSLTAVCLSTMLVHSAKMGFGLSTINPQSSTIELGRCNAVQAAKEANADYLLFLDSDMTFPATTLKRLFAHQKMVVGCDAARRRPPHTPVIGKTLKGKKFNYRKGGVVPVAGVGMAVTLINMKVFNMMETPYFETSYTAQKKFVSEDLCFCNKLRDIGHDIYCDLALSLEIGHLGVKEFKIKA